MPEKTKIEDYTTFDNSGFVILDLDELLKDWIEKNGYLDLTSTDIDEWEYGELLFNKLKEIHESKKVCLIKATFKNKSSSGNKYFLDEYRYVPCIIHYTEDRRYYITLLGGHPFMVDNGEIDNSQFREIYQIFVEQYLTNGLPTGYYLNISKAR